MTPFQAFRFLALFLALLLANAFSWVPVTKAQTAEDSVPLLSLEEGKALTDWAAGQLALLEAAPSEGSDALVGDVARLRALYHMTVNEKDRLDEARELAMALRTNPALSGTLSVTVEALGGALEVVRAKHSRWPPNKLNYLESGISVLDQLVQKNPDNVEVRYLRLMSCYYLPFFVSRGDSVAEDFRVLTDLLPRGPGTMPPALYRGAVGFVLAKGDLNEEDRGRLQEIVN